MMQIYISTSGWQYSHWKGKFYPENLPSQNFLKFYSKYFNTVEVNTSFYHFTKKSTLEKWRTQTKQNERRNSRNTELKRNIPIRSILTRNSLQGKNFLFSIKLHRLFTHFRKLKLNKEDKRILKETIENYKVLGKNLGPILIQLPPSLKKDLKTLEKFLKNFDKNLKLAIEFRHRSWLDKETYNFLKKKKIAFAVSDSPRWPTDIVKTCDFVYVRFHGKPHLFASKYGKEELIWYAKEIKKLKPKTLFAYFNNDAEGYAIENDLEFQKLLKRQ
mgnify:CR=1 FL=1